MKASFSGYEGGTFTGSKEKGMPGKLDLAQGGTIFLDEIGDLPIEMQPKLLRVLQERAFYRVGGLVKIPIDVRIVAATNKKLELMVSEGKFRKDLYYRLNSGWIFFTPAKRAKRSHPIISSVVFEMILVKIVNVNSNLLALWQFKSFKITTGQAISEN